MPPSGGKDRWYRLKPRLPTIFFREENAIDFGAFIAFHIVQAKHFLVKTINIKSQTRFSIRLRKVLRRLLAFLFGIAGIALIVYLDARLRSNTSLPELSLDMSSGLLFVVGFLTGFHCVGM